ncbi:MAG: ComEC family competence protein [Dysgonamonadaceae bacterium]|jgi:competence protein ComEC|nr:ComEC family competence protein [Dysgonamonadaceae bacterium]
MNVILCHSAFWRLLLPLVSGITLQFYWRLPFMVCHGVILLLSLFILACIFIFLKKYSLRGLFGTTLFCFSFVTGVVLVTCSLNDSKWEIPPEDHNYTVLLLEDPVLKPRSRMCKACIAGSDDSIFNQVAGKKIILYLPLNSSTEHLKSGDGISVKTTLKKPDQNKDSEFNYADYLEKQGFAAVGYVRKNNWRLQEISMDFIDRIKIKGLRSQNYIIHIIKEIIPEEKNSSIAEALFVGYKSDLSPELKSAFAETGAAHILAVSGLHLSILFTALCLIVAPFNNISYLNQIFRILIILLLWFFTFITGLSPSIVRACVMTSFFCIGIVINRKSFTMNVLAASALFMLLYNPLYLFDVGFQLSYGAVIAIVLINPYLVKIKEFKSKISGYFWELSCVSIAAQLGTTPVSMFYFGQFPAIFLLTNIFAIPISGVLLILLPLSILLRIIYDFPTFIFFPVNISLDFFVSGIEMLNNIPFSIIKGIRFDMWLLINSYLCIYLIFKLIKNRQPHYLYALVFLVVLQVFSYL